MQYLTYEEYAQIGGICESAFLRNIDRACGVIDNATHKRIEGMKSIPSQAKALCRDLVEYFAQNSATDTPTVSSRSQSAGSVSESESYAVKNADDITNEIENIVFDYLGSVTDDNGTPLLYRGCRTH